MKLIIQEKNSNTLLIQNKEIIRNLKHLNYRQIIRIIHHFKNLNKSINLNIIITNDN